MNDDPAWLPEPQPAAAVAPAAVHPVPDGVERVMAMAPRVVYRAEQTMEFGPGGWTPRIVEHHVPTTIWAPFGPVDYARQLQAWAPNLPRTETTEGGSRFGDCSAAGS